MSFWVVQGCVRDFLSRNRDETLQFPRRWSRPWSSLSRVSGASTSRRDVFCDVWWNTVTMKKIYGLINSHRGKRFLLFVILWVFALYFDNYHWIINGLHHCSAVDKSHYVYHNLQATEISKLQLIIALYVIYIWMIVFILTPYTLSTLRLGYFTTEKDWHDVILLYDK